MYYGIKNTSTLSFAPHPFVQTTTLLFPTVDQLQAGKMFCLFDHYQFFIIFKQQVNQHHPRLPFQVFLGPSVFSLFDALWMSP